MVKIIIEEWFPHIHQHLREQYFHLDFPRTIDFIEKSVNTQTEQM